MDNENRLVPNDDDVNVGGEPPKKKKEKKRKSSEEKKADRKVITIVLLLVIVITVAFYLVPKIENWKTNGFNIDFNNKKDLKNSTPKWGGYTEVNF